MLSHQLLMHSAYRVGPVICAVLVACGPGTATSTDAETDAETTTTGTTGTTGTTEPTGTGEPTTGETPMSDCEQVPLVLDAPRWSAEFAGFLDGLAVAPDGDGVLLVDDVIVRVGPEGVVWTQVLPKGEYANTIVAGPGGQVIAGGWFHEDGAATDPGLLLWFGPAGERLNSGLVDLDVDRNESIFNLATNAAGDVFVTSIASPPDQPGEGIVRVHRFDAAFAHVTTADGGPFRFVPALAADDEGNSYLATVDLMSEGDAPNIEYTWTLRVRSFGPDGKLRWTSDEFSIVTLNELVDLELSVGDQVYALMSNRGGHGLHAFSRAGEHLWAHSRSWGEVGDHKLHAVVASPCGGAYVGGSSDVEIDFISERASLFHVAPDGTFGTITYLLDTPHDGAYTFGETTDLAISPLGAIVAAGTLRPEAAAEDELGWVHGY